MNHFKVEVLQPIIEPEKLIQVISSLSQAIRTKANSALSSDLVFVKVADWIATPVIDFPNASLILDTRDRQN